MRMILSKGLLAVTVVAAVAAFGADATPEKGVRLEVPMLPGEHWWGLANKFGTEMPFDANSAVEIDLRADNYCNQASSFLVSDLGREIWCDEPVAARIGQGRIVLESASAPIELYRCGATLREAFELGARKHFLPSGRSPDPLFFSAPQYNTWIELTYHQNEKDILAYAQSMIDHGCPPGVLMIDDTWQLGYGTWEFDPRRFSDPKGMVAKLHAMGFRVMLWTCPYVSMDTPEYRRIADGTNPDDVRGYPTKGWFVMDPATGRPKACEWWNGQSAMLDLTHANAVAWYREQLDRLMRDYGVDGFKFDGGEIPSCGHRLNLAYSQFALDYPISEFRNAWQRQGQPIVERLLDKNHKWEDLGHLIPDMIGAGLLGHPFVCPDMVGGGQWVSFLPGSAFDAELFIRSAQVQALSPMMQFSASPWRVLDAEGQTAVRKAVALRQRHAKYISDLAVASGRSGAPMLRNLEWEFPGRGYAAIRDEFMLGERILVAPQLKKGAKSRTVVLPPGEWTDGNTGAVTVGPAEVEVATPLDRLPHFIRRPPREVALETFREKCRADGQRNGDFVLGRATPMEKIRPREGRLPEPARSLDVALARNEHEAVQLFVLPRRDLKSVRVDVSPLVAEGGGARLPAENVRVAVLGYVDVDRPPRFDIDDVGIAGEVATGGVNTVRAPDYDGVGWWPDPILDGLRQADVGKDDVQGFWIDVQAPAAQASGRYRGTVRVSAEGAAAKEIPIRVRVYGFEVPRKTPLPLAITFNPGPSWELATPVETNLNRRLEADPQAPVNCWKACEQEWYDFLADHYITIDSLYHRGLSDGKIAGLKRLADQGRLDCFNIGYWRFPKTLDDAGKAHWRKDTLEPLQVAWKRMRQAGLEKYAYIYGCDEVKPKFFENIRWAVSELKRAFPGVPLATTAYDDDFGVGTVLSGIDWFTPITPKYDVAKAGLARKEGRQVWWYICCGPGQPFANMFITHRAIEGRSLMGAQTAKYRPDGFLYYQTSLWNSVRPIDGRSAFTDWTARSWHTIFGDGSWTCCGAGGRPLTTVRLENFRDGLEDYAYVLALERKLKASPSAPWAEEARTLIAVPDGVVRDLKDYSVDPVVLYAWRNRMAELIEQ